MNYWQKIRKAAGLLLGGALLLGAGGCSLMHDDLQPCAVKPSTRTTVNFIYDYNTEDKDLFAESVGGVTLYVFDADGILCDLREFSNATTENALKAGDFKVEFNSEEIEPGKEYTFYAVAHAHDSGYTGAVTLPGAAFRRTELVKGSHTPFDFSIVLDRDGDGIVDHEGVMIDALWISRVPVTLEVPEEVEPAEGDPQEPDHLLDVTVPLMRVTNTIRVTFFETDFPDTIDPSYYEARLVTDAGAGKLDILGNPLADGKLNYKPVRQWTSVRSIDGVPTACITAEFGVSRLMFTSNLMLEIDSQLTGITTRVENLPFILSRGNEAYAEKGWSRQEYLDRQYDYDFDMPLGDPIPKWIQLNIGILSWSKRVQTENF